MTAPPVMWTPSPERVQRAHLTRFMRWLEEGQGLRFEDYEALWRWSVQELEPFWASIWEFFGVRASQPYECVLGSQQMPGAQWFPGARLNYAEHVFRDRRDQDVAIVFADERGELGQWTWGALRAETAGIARGLRELGVVPGDRVVAYMPNAPETVAAFLATASIGAIWSSCSPDFGARGVLDRFAQIEPKVLLAVGGYSYQGRVHDRREVVAELRSQLPTLQHTVVLGRVGDAGGVPGGVPGDLSGGVPGDVPGRVPGGVSGDVPGGVSGDVPGGVSGDVPGRVPGGVPGRVPGTIDWEQLRATQHDLAFEQLPFDHPLWVLYSSGTTGLPKAIVQGHGGILIEQLKKLHLHVDLHAEDRIFWFTTTGWMMWNFLVGCLLTEATIVLYDGSPTYPEADSLWELVERAGITCFGTSAGYLSACQKQGIRPAQGRSLSALHSVGSTGSTLPPESFDWVYQQLDPDTWLFSTSGGTDVCTAFLGGCPLLPVRRGELQCRALGASVQAFDEQGKPVIGQLGELVITRPMPSMPLRFWNDPGDARYKESYFSVYPGVWRHGDWIEISERGSATLHGRSDATINRGGVRMGSSEIYRAVLAVPEVQDALVVDVEGWMPLFVSLGEGVELDEALRQEIKRRVRADCSPRHVPNEIFAVPTIPRTRTGKVLEVPVKRILMGAPPERAASREALADASALEPFIALAAQRREASAGRGEASTGRGEASAGRGEASAGRREAAAGRTDTAPTRTDPVNERR